MVVGPFKEPDGDVVSVPLEEARSVEGQRTVAVHPQYAGDLEMPAATERRVIPPTASWNVTTALRKWKAAPRHADKTRRPSGPIALAAEGDGCSNFATSVATMWWSDRVMNYQINTGALGGFAGVVEYGANGWRDTRTDCTGSFFTDQNNINMVNVGTTSETGPTFSSVNSVSRGQIDTSCGATALACAWTWYWQNTTSLTEADIVLDTDRCFYTDSPSSSCYDARGIFTHEFGHAIGVQHTSGRWLTMDPYSYPGDTSARTLAAGDIDGMRVLYPEI